MLWALLLGCFAFGLMILYDWLDAYRGKHISILFFLGGGSLIAATVWLIVLCNPLCAFNTGPVRFVVGAVGALTSTAGMVYALFFALPFSGTYAKAGVHQCICTGWYALCRHPAALFHYVIFAFLLLMVPTLPMLLGFLVFPNLNLAYVALQDCSFFPRTIEGYVQYQKETPFLIPTRESIKRMRGSESR